MNVQCAVSSCPNSLRKTGGGIKYYRFPEDQGVRSVWTVRCDRRDNWNPSTSYICSSHFTNDDYTKLPYPPYVKKLHPDAVPSRNLKLYGWDMGEATCTDSDAEDPFIRSMIKTSSRRKAGKSPRPSQSDQTYVQEESASEDSSSDQSETELSEAECGTSSARRKKQVVVSLSGPELKSPQAKRKKRSKKKYCDVLTCRAEKTKEFHYFPQDKEMQQKWIDAIFHGEPHHRTSNTRTKKCICRRHFTEDDYCDPPSSGAARRLSRGVVPSVNIPICRAEVRLARLKLYLDVNRRKPEERNLSFPERLMREPELYDLYREYQDEVKDIDPARVHILPVLHANGELVGPGEPAPGDPSFIPRKELKQIELKIQQAKIKAAKKASLAEVYEERRKIRLARKREYYRRKKELRKLLHSDPLAYDKLLAEDEKEEQQAQKEQRMAQRIVKKANAGTQQFGDKMAIFAQDPEKGAKYKVIVKKVIKKKDGSSLTTERVLNPAEGAELFKKVISKVDVTGAKRIKFSNADKITKMSNMPLQLQKSEQSAKDHSDNIWSSDVTNLVTPGVGTSQVSEQADQSIHVSSAVEDDAQQEPDNDPIYDDDHHDDNYDDDNHRSEYDMDTEAIPIVVELVGPDHCYTTKTCIEEEGTPAVDPFVELQEQLRAMPEDEARMLVKEKMDGYRAVFKQQVTKLRQLLRARQKTDRKVRCLTRILCLTLREQITKYYGL